MEEKQNKTNRNWNSEINFTLEIYIINFTETSYLHLPCETEILFSFSPSRKKSESRLTSGHTWTQLWIIQITAYWRLQYIFDTSHFLTSLVSVQLLVSSYLNKTTVFKLSAPTNTVGLNVLPHEGHPASFVGEPVSRKAKQFRQRIDMRKHFYFSSLKLRWGTYRRYNQSYNRP